MALLDADALKTEWQSLFRLLHNEKGIRLRLVIPEIVVLQHGLPTAWFYTSNEGYVVQQAPARTTIEEVKTQFLRHAADASGECVAIMRMADGLPKLLSRSAFVALCDSLAAQAAGWADDEPGPGQAPVLLQSWVQPSLDLRYVTSYANDGVNLTCLTFQRRFSSRYLPLRDGILRLQPGVLASTAPDAGSNGSGGSSGVEGGAMPEAPAAGAACAAAIAVTAAPADSCWPPQLGQRDLTDMDRSLDKALGPVDPSLKMASRRAAHGLVQYVQRAHLLTIRGLVCEFVRDGCGNLCFMGPLRVDWASVIPGRGGQPWANANLTAAPREEESWSDGSDAEGEQHKQWQQQQQQQDLVGERRRGAVTGDVMNALAGPSGRQETGPDVQRRPQPCSPSRPLASIAEVTEGCSRSGFPLPRLQEPSPPQQQSLSPSQQQHQQQHLQQPGANQFKSGALPVVTSGMSVLPDLNASPKQQRQPSPPPRTSPSARQGSASSGLAARRERSPGGGSNGCKSMMNGFSSAPKSPAMLASHLTRELVAIKDELVLKADLVEQLEAKVDVLEHDKRVITDAFESVVHHMQSDMTDVKCTLERLRSERDALQAQLADARAALAQAKEERDELRGRLDGERGTAMSTLETLQAQQAGAEARAVTAEEALHRLQSKLLEELAVSDALKKQMVFYQHAVLSSGLAPVDPTLLPGMGAGAGTGSAGGAGGGAGGGGVAALALLRGSERPELRYWEMLVAVEDLLLREADPDGERYSLAKVLHTCQADLHPIFLHYCLLDPGWARHWPPQLTLNSWLTFMKDTGVTNLVPGVRTRSDITIHVQDAQEVFRRYSLRQAIVSGGSIPRSTSTKALSSRSPGTTSAGAPGEPTTTTTRPTSASSTATGVTVAGATRPSSPKGAAGFLSYQGFCAALVHVAARTARQGADAMDACPFLSEQVRAYVESIVPKAQRVAGATPASKKPGAAGAVSPGGAALKQKGGGSPGAKEPSAKQAGAKPKANRERRSPPRPAGGGEALESISEASHEVSLRQGIGAD